MAPAEFYKDRVIKIDTQIIIIIVFILAIVGFGFMMSKSVKSYETKKASEKKKKGRTKYMPEVKNPKK